MFTYTNDTPALEQYKHVAHLYVRSPRGRCWQLCVTKISYVMHFLTATRLIADGTFKSLLIHVNSHNL